MSRFLRALDERNPPRWDRRWIFVPEDQLSDDIGPISRSDPREIGIILIESHWKAARRPYHKQKLALLWSNLRHFAIEQASRGVAVRYLTTTQPFQATLAPLIAKLGPLTVMEPAERELRADLDPLVRIGEVIVLPHEGWLTTREQFIRGAGEGSPWRMDAFYRFVRKDTGILMDGDVPVGGRFSYDVLNRRRWAGDPPAPNPLSFPIDEITAEVGELIDRYFSRHPGEMDLSTIPATDKDAQRLWRWAKRECLPHLRPLRRRHVCRLARTFSHSFIFSHQSPSAASPADGHRDSRSQHFSRQQRGIYSPDSGLARVRPARASGNRRV